MTREIFAGVIGKSVLFVADYKLFFNTNYYVTITLNDGINTAL